jgi:uncharacterized protein (TIGR04222 family)
MNPFDLTGPQFLLFYALLGVLVNVWLRRHVRGPDPDRYVSLTSLTADPYRIAYLRNGVEAASRLAVVTLIDRGLLRIQGGQIRTVDADAPGLVRRPIEREVLRLAVPGCAASAIESAGSIRRACDVYEEELARRELIENEAGRQTRRRAVMVAVLVLAGVAVFKLAIAAARGRPNVLFLIVLSAIFVIASLVVLRRNRTGLGDKALENLATLFARLKRQAGNLRPGGLTNEAMLLAAVFGIHALPVAAFAFVDEVYPRRQSGSDGGGGDGGGSSGDGGGSGCGGCGGGGD